MNYLKKSLFFLLISFILTNCSGSRVAKPTYDQQMNAPLSLYRAMRFREAADVMSRETTKIIKSIPVDKYLAFLEFGRISLAGGYTDYAIKYLTLSERRFLDVEGTISINEEVSSIFTNDTSKEYMLEPHEIVMISPYLALAYLEKGDEQAAFVERNRAISRISEYIERSNMGWLDNYFARYLSAVLYEKQNKIQDARIEYIKIQQKSPNKGPANEALQNLNNRNKGNFVCFIDLGLSPVKREEIYDKRIPHGNDEIQVKFAYAVMQPSRYNRVKKVKVLINGEDRGESEILVNIENIVMTQFNKNKNKITEGIVKRVLPRLIAQVAGQQMAQSRSTGARLIGSLMSLGSKISMAIEKADTRSWLSLPRLIHVFRTRGLPEGDHTYQIQYIDRSGNVIGSSPVKNFKISSDKDIAITNIAVPM